MTKKLFALAVLTCGMSIPAVAEVPLQIYSGQRDTVTTERIVVVAVTSPGASATINGDAVHVEPTGSFGAELTLNPGSNTVTVTASTGGETTRKQFNVFRASAVSATAGAATTQTEEVFTTPFFVETLPGAYLTYSNGGDRLGGSKMGYVAAGVPLKVVGRSDENYKVQLSQARWAYIPAEYVGPTTSTVGIVNTSSWSVSNEGTYDRVSVALPARLPYRYFTTLDPSTIVVELYGATDNSNWITQRTMELGMIDHVDFNQVESDIYQVIIHMKKHYQWGFHIDYSGTRLVIDVRHTPADLNLKALTIGLDAGHGGEYPGAISPSGIKEKDVNLDIVLRLRQLLERAGATVVMTRDSDTSPSMADRRRAWQEANVDLAISVHNNSGGSPLSSPGTSTYYKHLFDRPLAAAVLSRMLETGLPLFGLVGNFNFSLNGPTEFPNTLVECAFMSSLADEARLADPAFRQTIAEKIFRGIQDYLAQVKAEK